MEGPGMGTRRGEGNARAFAVNLVSHHQDVRSAQELRRRGVRSSPRFAMYNSNPKSSRGANVSMVKPVGKSMQMCQGCHKPIRDKYLLNSLGRNWHEDCLKCNCCEARLGEVGESLYTRANLILCKRDYLRIFGNTGLCSACSKTIPAFEFVMRAKTNVYHLDCFACQLCGYRFCVGDRFYLSDNKILCESDYNERIMYGNANNARMAVNSPVLDQTNYYRSVQMGETNDCNNNGHNQLGVL